MVKLYTSINVSQYSKILKTKNLALINLSENTLGLEFTEDKNYWIQALQVQEDLDNVSDYIDKHIQFYNEEDDSLKFHELTKLKKTFFELSEKKLNDAWLKARALK